MKDSMDEKDIDIELEQEETPDTNETELVDIDESSEKKIKDIKKKLKECEEEKMEYLENLQRAKAEFLNARKRIDEQRMRDEERAINNQIEKLLPMCDSFHIAMSNKEVWESTDETWRKGIENIYNQLQSILASYNVKEISPKGAEFDPSLHEAMANIPVHDKKENHKIVSVIQNGFVRRINGKDNLIRPARVTVGEYTE